MDERPISGAEFSDAIGRSGLKTHEVTRLLGIKNSALYDWKLRGVPTHRAKMVATRLGTWLHQEGDAAVLVDDERIRGISDVALLAELGRRLAEAERSNASATKEANSAHEGHPAGKYLPSEDKSPSIITGRGPSSRSGGGPTNDQSIEDDR